MNRVKSYLRLWWFTAMEWINDLLDDFFGLAPSSVSVPKGWFVESNRWKHYVGGCVLGLFATVLCAIGAGAGMEFKDVQWSGSWKNWDWLDLLATVLGGLTGQVVQLLIILAIWG